MARRENGTQLPVGDGGGSEVSAGVGQDCGGAGVGYSWGGSNVRARNLSASKGPAVDEASGGSAVCFTTCSDERFHVKIGL